MHSPLCRHATGEPEDYARQAVAARLTEIGFSDHAPMRQDNFDQWRMNAAQLDEYVEKVQKARAAFPRLVIRLGLEVDFMPGQEAWIAELAGRHPWDYFIGSVHYVSDDWAVDDPQKLSEWNSRDPFDVWRIYFTRLTMAAESKLFDIIGHADLPKKFGHRPAQDCRPLYAKFLDAAAASGCAIELNTAGLRKDCKEIYPNRTLLEMAFERNVAITFGSDAHAPDEVGKNFDEAVALARSAGYRVCRRMARRQSRLVEF